MEELKYQIINFVCFAAVLVYFVRKPLLDSIAKRHTDIKTAVEEAKIQRLAAEKKLKELENKIAALEAETAGMLAKAAKDADQMKNKIIGDAKTNALRIIKDAEFAAASALQDQKNEIKNEVVSKAIALAEKMIREKLSSEDQKRIVTEFGKAV